MICRCWEYCCPSAGVENTHLQVLEILLAICRYWEYCSPSAGPPDTVSQAGSVGRNRTKPVGPLCTSLHCNTVPRTSLQDGSTNISLQDGSTRTSPRDSCRTNSCWRKAGVIVGTANSKQLLTRTQGLPRQRISLPF